MQAINIGFRDANVLIRHASVVAFKQNAEVLDPLTRWRC